MNSTFTEACRFDNIYSFEAQCPFDCMYNLFEDGPLVTVYGQVEYHYFWSCKLYLHYCYYT